MGRRGQKKEKYRVPALKLKCRILLYICMAASASLALFDVAYHVLPYLVGIMIYVLADCNAVFLFQWGGAGRFCGNDECDYRSGSVRDGFHNGDLRNLFCRQAKKRVTEWMDRI